MSTDLPGVPAQALRPEERRLALALGLLAVVFAGATLVFAFGTRPLLASINTVTLALLPGATPIPETTERFWLTLSLSMMVMITYVGAMGYRDVRRNLPLVPVLLLSKFCSSVLGLLLAIVEATPAYLSIPLSDFPIFLLVWVLYRRVLKLPRAAEPAP